MNLIKFVSTLVLLLIGVFHIYSCAAIQGPPGGPKDETPPELIQIIPEDGEVHFEGGRVELVFSEYVDANSVEKAIRVLPIISEEPKIIYKGRRVYVEFPDSLAQDQTYIIVVDRSLKDEHGVFFNQGEQVAFATGDNIDRGSISGIVIYDKPVAVQLWKIRDKEDDSQFYNREPEYVVDASNEGDYNFKYLSKGVYKIVAVDRSSSGRPIVLGRMNYGLSWFPNIQLTDQDTLTGVDFRIPKKIGNTRMLRAEWMTGNWCRVIFSEDISDWFDALPLRLIHPDSSVHVPDYFLDPMDESVLHIVMQGLDDLDFVTLGINSLVQGEETLIDSGMIKVKVDTTRDTTYLEIKSPKNNHIHTIEEDRTVPLGIIFSKLIDVTQSVHSFQLMQDTVLVPFLVNWETPLVARLEPKMNWEPNAQYTLQVRRDSLIPVFGRTLQDSVGKYLFKTSEYQGFGQLIGQTTESVRERVVAEVESMEKEPQIFRTVVNSEGTFDMNRLPEGNYFLSFFKDSDGDNRYSFGNLSPYRPSEWFYLYPDTVKIRANWDLELNQINMEK